MKIYRLLGSGGLYVLSYKVGRLTGRQLQYALYDPLAKQQCGFWTNVPVNMIKKFEAVYEQ